MPFFNIDNEGFHAPNTSPPTSQDLYVGTWDLGNEASHERQVSQILRYPHVSDSSAIVYQASDFVVLDMSHQVIFINQGIPVNQGYGLYEGNPSYPVITSYPVHTNGEVNVARSLNQMGPLNMTAPSQVNLFCNVPISIPQSFPTGAQMGTWNPGVTILNGSHRHASHTWTNHTGSWIAGTAVLNNSQPHVSHNLANHTGAWLPGAAVSTGPHPQPQVLHTSSIPGYNAQISSVLSKRVRRSHGRSQVATTNMYTRPTTWTLSPILSSKYIPALLYSTGVTLEKFCLFNKFPREIRFMIWHLTMVPRVVEVRISRRDAKDRGRQMYKFESFTPKPKVFFICPETRREAMKCYKAMFAHEVNGVTRYIWVGLRDTIYFSFFRSGIGGNKSAAAMLWTTFKKAGDYDRVAIPQGIPGKPKIYENSTVQFLTHVAVPLPFKNPHFKLLAELLVLCPKLKSVRLWNNVLPCTPRLQVLLKKRGQGKMLRINDVAPITDPAVARHIGNFNEEQARDHLIGLLKNYINGGDHPTGLKEMPLVELGRIEAVDDEQWREFFE